MVCSPIGQLVRGVAVLTVVWHVSVSPVTCQPQPGENDHDFIKLTNDQPIHMVKFKERLVTGKESCYNHFAREIFGVLFRVVEERGAIEARIVSPRGFVQHFDSQSTAFFTSSSLSDTETGVGYYLVCFINRGSPIHVHVQMFTFIQQKVEESNDELLQLNIKATEFAEKLTSISMATQQALVLVTDEEQTLLRDIVFIIGTNKSVQLWSVAICVMEVVIALVTVYCIRGLFTVSDRKIRPR